MLKFLKANCEPGVKIFNDVLKRDNSIAPKAGLYIAGFPCQPFSSSGKRKGFRDPRGTVFGGCVDYIRSAKPRAFILENVKGLLDNDGGRAFREVLSILRSVVRPRYYRITYKVVNTAHHGVPHNRPRVYIIGIRHDFDGASFRFPPKQKCGDIEDLLGPVENVPDETVLPPATQTTANSNLG